MNTTNGKGKNGSSRKNDDNYEKHKWDSRKMHC